jgi:aspartyl-tRNA(Asn)/glutamyl-tRNA(Gln) amidotransferase subunit A
MDLTKITLASALKSLKAGEYTAAELTQHYLERIAAVDSQVESYLYVNQAAAEEASTAKGALAGVPIAHKDVFCTADAPTTVASRVLEGYHPPYDATVVARLRSAGVVSLGKLNTDEFVMGSSCESSAYRKTRNPWDLTRVPGGSSGGSAAAVAASLCLAATGSDTGGSIRQPAALCGVTGFKPTYGRIGRYGAIAMASSLDTVGFLTRTVEDAAILLAHTAGTDPHDATSGRQAVPDYVAALTGASLAGKTVGIPREYFVEGLDSAVAEVVQTAIKELEKLGAKIKPISLPHTEYAVPTYYILASSEISANLARFDGIRFGPAAEHADDLIASYFAARTAGLGAEVKRRIMLGTFTLSAGYADAYYKKSLQVRTLIKQDFDTAFTEVDFIAAPVSPTTAFALGEKSDDPLAMYLADIFTIPASLAGIPGVSLPCGFVQGLPVGLQLLAPQWHEAELLAAAHAYQTATDWHTQTPVL